MDSLIQDNAAQLRELEANGLNTRRKHDIFFEIDLPSKDAMNAVKATSRSMGNPHPDSCYINSTHRATDSNPARFVLVVSPSLKPNPQTFAEIQLFLMKAAQGYNITSVPWNIENEPNTADLTKDFDALCSENGDILTSFAEKGTDLSVPYPFVFHAILPTAEACQELQSTVKNDPVLPNDTTFNSVAPDTSDDDPSFELRLQMTLIPNAKRLSQIERLLILASADQPSAEVFWEFKGSVA